MSYRGYGNRGGGHSYDYSNGNSNGGHQYTNSDDWKVAKDAVPSKYDQKSLSPQNHYNNPNFIPITDSKNKYLNLKKDQSQFEKNVSVLTDEINRSAETSQFTSYKKNKY
jgi:hypothetical protein